MSEPNGKSGGISLSIGTLQFLIQLGLLLGTVMAFGFTIKGAVEVQGVRLEAMKEENQELKKEVKLLSYTLSQVQTDVGIIKAGRWRPTKGEQEQ